VARLILDAMRRDETVLVDETRRGYHPGRAQCKVADCNPHFAVFTSTSGDYSAPITKITASYVSMMQMTLFTLSD